jgi:hypothetical protein
MSTGRRVTGQIAAAATPDWRPLFRAVGEELMATFMWMFSVEIAEASALQAYKHIHTRRYLHLDERGAAFMHVGGRGYQPIALAIALEAVLAPWWDGLGASAEEVLATWTAIERARR